MGSQKVGHDWATDLIWSELHHARPPCSSPSPEVCQSSCPLHQWCHPAICFKDHCPVMEKGFCNTVKLWAMPCRATQDGWVLVQSSEKMWSAGGGNGKPPQGMCCENLMNCIKGQNRMLGATWTFLQHTPSLGKLDTLPVYPCQLIFNWIPQHRQSSKLWLPWIRLLLHRTCITLGIPLSLQWRPPGGSPSSLPSQRVPRLHLTFMVKVSNTERRCMELIIMHLNVNNP